MRTARGLFSVAVLLAVLGGPDSAQAAFMANLQATSNLAASGTRVSLVDVSMVPGDKYAWAVGEVGFMGPTPLLTFNGHSWTTVAVKLPSDTELTAASPTTKTAGWVVGYTGLPGSTAKPFLASVAGTSVHQVDLKSYGGGIIYSVAELSAKDAWAVGYLQSKSSRITPLALNWNGTSWRQVKVLSEQAGLVLQTVTSAAPAGWWMIGSSQNSNNSEVMRWTGSTWVASLTTSSATLTGIAATSSTDAWLVGDGSPDAYAAHWNGTKWQTVATPTSVSELNAVAMSGKRVWLAGDAMVSGSPDRLIPVMLYSTGGAPGRQAVPDPGGSTSSESQSRFEAIAAASADFVIAVGDNGNECELGTGFADVYNGKSWIAAALPPTDDSTGAKPTCGG